MAEHDEVSARFPGILPGGRGPVLAIDIGGTKMAAGLVRPDGRLVAERRVPTPAAGAAEVLWTALRGLLDQVLADAGGPPLVGVGVGCVGPMRWPAGVVSPVNVPGWRGFPLRDRLAEAFPGVPVRVHNDAVCAALAEHWQGASRGVPGALGMVVSTGVGGGLVLGDRVVDGSTGNAGHIGHLVVDPAGPACPCGGRGCLEVMASGTAVTRDALAAGWTPPPGLPPSGVTVAAAARAGDPVARAAFERAGWYLGIGIAGAVTLTDVSIVTIGGGLAQAGALLFDPLRASYAERAAMPHAAAARIVPAALGDRAGLIGAASLVLAGHRYWTPD